MSVTWNANGNILLLLLDVIVQSKMSPSELNPSLYPSIPSALTILPRICAVRRRHISNRLLLLLMGDVNHRCANNTEKHVHTQDREGERERKAVIALLLSFQYADDAMHTSPAMLVHLTLCVLICFFLLLSLSLANVVVRRARALALSPLVVSEWWWGWRCRERERRR